MQTLLRRLPGNTFWAAVAVALLLGALAPDVGADEMRFPKPEFTSGYDFPETSIAPPKTQTAQWIDVLLLTLALSVATLFAVKTRSRRGIFWLSVICLGYFGFVKEGCVCPIGAIQNVALGIFDSNTPCR